MIFIIHADENVLAELFANVAKVPSRFSDLCLQAFTARQELIDYFKEFAGQMVIFITISVTHLLKCFY